jgi:4-amino-4-deoxy-L-arabinose transferase-like glycosyltransferase
LATDLSLSKTSNTWYWLIPVAVMLAITYLYPLGFDNNTYQSMAWQLVEKGKLPYVDTWDQNFPGIVYLHSLSIILFGNSNGGFRALDILIQLLIALMIHRVVARYSNAEAASLATLFFVGFYVISSSKMLGQRDVYAGAALFVSVYSAFRARDLLDSKLLPVASGLLLGMAILIRPTYALCAVIIAALLWQRKDRLRTVMLAAVSTIVVTVIGLSPYLFNAQNFADFYASTIRFNTEVYGTATQRLAYSHVFWYPLELSSTLLIIGLAFVGMKMKAREGLQSDRVQFALWCFGIAVLMKIMVYVMGKYLIYHYAPVFIFLTPLVGYVRCESFKRIGESWQSKALKIAFATVLVVFAALRSPIPIIAAAPGSWHDRMEEVASRYAVNWYSYADARALCDYIARNTTPDDEIEMSSMDNEIVWTCERSQCTRFTLVHPLGMRNNGEYSADQIRWRQEFVDKLRTRKPKLVMITSQPKSFMTFLDRSPEDILMSIPGLSELLSTQFRLDTVMGPWKVYAPR